MSSHQSAAANTVVWLTPRAVLNALGPFDLDPCAAPAPRPWPTADVHYTEVEGDGLSRPWFGRCWVNPPYGDDAWRWLMKLADHGRGTALVFARTETAGFFKTVWERAHALLFLRGRLTFCRPDGTTASANGGAPSVLIAHGADDVDRLRHSGLEGAFVPLALPVMIHVTREQLAAEAPELSWRQLLAAVLRREDRALSLSEIYALISRHPKAARNPHWREKARQTLRRGGFMQTAHGQYALAV